MTDEYINTLTLKKETGGSKKIRRNAFEDDAGQHCF